MSLIVISERLAPATVSQHRMYRVHTETEIRLPGQVMQQSTSTLLRYTITQLLPNGYHLAELVTLELKAESAASTLVELLLDITRANSPLQLEIDVQGQLIRVLNKAVLAAQWQEILPWLQTKHRATPGAQVLLNQVALQYTDNNDRLEQALANKGYCGVMLPGLLGLRPVGGDARTDRKTLHQFFEVGALPLLIDWQTSVTDVFDQTAEVTGVGRLDVARFDQAAFRQQLDAMTGAMPRPPALQVAWAERYTGKQYVYNGVLLRCDKGVAPSPFTVLPRPSRIRGQFQAHELDKVPLVNIKSFGVCAITHAPCIPAPLMWTGVHRGALRLGPMGAHPLLESSTCQCSIGGKISIMMPPALGASGSPTPSPAGNADAMAHEVADGFKWAALSFAVLGVGLAIAGCFFPPLELAAGASFEAALAASASTAFVAADVSMTIGIGIDVGVAVTHPTPANQAVVVGDAVGLALGYGAGKLIGAAVSKFGPAVVEVFAQKAAQREASSFRPLMSEADPVADLLGPGRLSHAEEWSATINKLEGEGVEVVYRENTMAYSPATSPGKPGQLIIDENASISALRHETQHYADDKANGFIGMRQLYDPDLRWQMEYNAYMKEVNMMREMREYETARKLVENARAEKLRIIRDIGTLSK